MAAHPTPPCSAEHAHTHTRKHTHTHTHARTPTPTPTHGCGQPCARSTADSPPSPVALVLVSVLHTTSMALRVCVGCCVGAVRNQPFLQDSLCAGFSNQSRHQCGCLAAWCVSSVAGWRLCQAAGRARVAHKTPGEGKLVVLLSTDAWMDEQGRLQGRRLQCVR